MRPFWRGFWVGVLLTAGAGTGLVLWLDKRVKAPPLTPEQHARVVDAGFIDMTVVHKVKAEIPPELDEVVRAVERVEATIPMEPAPSTIVVETPPPSPPGCPDYAIETIALGGGCITEKIEPGPMIKVGWWAEADARDSAGGRVTAHRGTKDDPLWVETVAYTGVAPGRPIYRFPRYALDVGRHSEDGWDLRVGWRPLPRKRLLRNAALYLSYQTAPSLAVVVPELEFSDGELVGVTEVVQSLGEGRWAYGVRVSW